MAGSQEREGNAQGACTGSERPATSPRAPETDERAHQQAIPAVEHDRRGGDGNGRQRVSLVGTDTGQSDRDSGHTTHLQSGDEFGIVSPEPSQDASYD